MIGRKTEGFSGSQFCFVVEDFDNGAGNLSFGAEPVQQQWPVEPGYLGPVFIGSVFKRMV